MRYLYINTFPMGFSNIFWRNADEEDASHEDDNSFANLSDEELDAHLGIDTYNGFKLTDAVRPSYDLKIVPSEGYRCDTYFYEDDNSCIPVLMAAVSREKLWDLFIDLIEPLGEQVDVVLEANYDKAERVHSDFWRSQVDLSVLKKILEHYKDQIMNDGYLGVVVLNPCTKQEVQFDDHKLLAVYGERLTHYERILKDYSVQCRDDMRFITEVEHAHSTMIVYRKQAHQLIVELGMNKC